MKENRERILKYLSDLMDEGEKSEFEKELKESKSLNEETDSIKVFLNALDYKVNSVDERYFNSLLPKVRSRLERSSRKSFLYGWKYVLPVAAVCIIAIVILFKQYSAREITSAEIVKEIVNNIRDKKVSDNYFSDLDLDWDASINVDAKIDDTRNLNLEGIDKQEILNSYYYPVSEEYLSIQNLSDEDLKGIISKISTKNTY